MTCNWWIHTMTLHMRSVPEETSWTTKRTIHWRANTTTRSITEKIIRTTARTVLWCVQPHVASRKRPVGLQNGLNDDVSHTSQAYVMSLKRPRSDRTLACPYNHTQYHRKDRVGPRNGQCTNVSIQPHKSITDRPGPRGQYTVVSIQPHKSITDKTRTTRTVHWRVNTTT